MYKALTGILIPVLVIAVLGTGFWGYQENQEKNSVLIKAENQYQRAFHDLNFHVDQLQDELGKSLAINSRDQLSPCLANVWRLAYTAQSDVSQLPLILMPFNQTEEFLAKISDFSYRVAIRDLSRDPLTDKEYETLQVLYEDAKKIQKDLHNVQAKVIEENLRWMDVELALSQEDKQMDNTIIDGLKTINKKVEEFPEVDWGPGVNSLQQKDESKAKNISGDPITKEEAKKKALKFLGLSDREVEVDNTGKGADYEAFSVSVKNNEDTVHLDVTKKGGHVVWMIINREIKDEKLTIRQAMDKANQFLEKKGFKSMTTTRLEEFGNSVVFDFSLEEQGVLIYPDTVSVKVALDDGQIIGFQSVAYLFNHKERNIPRVEITEAEAKKRVNPKVKIQDVKRAMIENFNNEEVLTYEFTGELNGVYYKIYINASSGREEEVKKVTVSEFNLD